MSSLHRTARQAFLRPIQALLAAVAVTATLLVAPAAQADTVLEAEPNTTTSTAQVLPLGTTVSGSFTEDVSCAYFACDTYKTTAGSAGRLQLDLRFADDLGTDGRLYIRVHDAAGSAIYDQTLSSADYDGSRLRALAMYVDSGVFYVSISASGSSLWSNEQYSFTATVTPGVVETERNDSTATADSIALGRTIAGSLFDGNCAYSDCDVFRLTMPQASKLSVDFRFSCDLGTGSLYEVSTIDNAGNRITRTPLGGADCDGAALRSVQVIAPAGNVYVEVTPRSSVTRAQEYKLTVTRTDTPAPDVDVTRLAGSDRQGTAVEISKATFAPGVPVTYVATGSKFPDALAAAPAAATQGGPLLLVDRDSMSPAVRAELTRLIPSRIVVVGSAASVSDALLADLRNYVPSGDVVRIGGVDRYDTANRIVDYAFPSGASTAWVATGEKFPDALSASAAAGAVDAPVILVNGGLSTTTAQTRQLVTDLGAASLTIAGSALSVSEGIKNSLPVPSTRIGGSDRYDTSEKLNKAAFTAAETVYFATGENFPDALAGATAAGYTGSPLFAVRPNCVPRAVLDDITALGASKVVLLGGPGTLSDSVARLTSC
ncbi:hypothetical protein GRS96_00575 [Rathayibacter sp. VKM Ac-2803]|uniref:cell wall-binding repeat-containing protein n=1 Tax=Rathayibacter sp. VKM Ac-2803 TaxID=2609256 RepID=UPI0013595FB4|nr:cell wall-binding repeat-containing protein [Rathayibacter sp. VKM Ac-2803]MWV47766.1 hypothetical protein [Rathayibacter sp. VKM Ac-2803]